MRTTRAILARVLLALAIGVVVTVGVAWFAVVRERWAETTCELLCSSPATWPEPVPASWKPPLGGFMAHRWGARVTRLSSSTMSYTMTTGAVLTRWNGDQEIHTVGWPMDALAGSMCRATDAPGDRLRWLWRVPWGTKAVMPLPLHPVWPGFVINTLPSAAIAWGLLAAPGAIRRWRRRRGGRCVKCGYDRAGLADALACPECGSAAGEIPAPRGR